MYLYLPFCGEESHIISALYFFFAYFTRSPRRLLNGKVVRGSLCYAALDTVLLVAGCLLPWHVAALPQATLYPCFAWLFLLQSWQLGLVVPLTVASVVLLSWTRREWYPGVLVVAVAKIGQAIFSPTQLTVRSALTGCVVSELKLRIYASTFSGEVLPTLLAASAFAPLNPLSVLSLPAEILLLCRQRLPQQTKLYQVVLLSLAVFFSGLLHETHSWMRIPS